MLTLYTIGFLVFSGSIKYNIDQKQVKHYFMFLLFFQISLGIGSKWNVLKRCPGRFLNIMNVQLTFYVSRGFVLLSQNILKNKHFLKSVNIRSYSGPYFPAFGLNTNQNNSEYGHFKFLYMLLSCTYQTIYTLCHHVLYIHSLSMIFPRKSNMNAWFSIMIGHVIIFPIQRVSNFGFR